MENDFKNAYEDELSRLDHDWEQNLWAWEFSVETSKTEKQTEKKTKKET